LRDVHGGSGSVWAHCDIGVGVKSLGRAGSRNVRGACHNLSGQRRIGGDGDSGVFPGFSLVCVSRRGCRWARGGLCRRSGRHNSSQTGDSDGRFHDD
jgi:hypothetical protein